MPIRRATALDVEAWADLRALLWPDTTLAQHRQDAMEMLDEPENHCAVFLDSDTKTGIRAFAEATLRHDHVHGCNTSPVAFLEGIYVRPEARGIGIGRRLLDAIETWARKHGCTEFASDADLTNPDGHAFHEALGFDETDRVICFHKSLRSDKSASVEAKP